MGSWFLRAVWCTLIGFLACCSRANSADQHALIVGVSEYPSLGASHRLFGPERDVLLMQRLLKEKLAFPEDSVEMLSEQTGKEAPSKSPTAVNIRAAFASLISKAESGDEVVVYLSGHGAQQPADGTGQHRERDGLDGIFLPRDVDRWDGSQSKAGVPNAITDNEFAKWFTAIRDRGARLWVIIDSCHAGDLSRGRAEKVRFVDPVSKDGLRIPPALYRRARDRSTREADETNDQSRFDIPDLTGMVFFYACEEHEKTIENRLPGSSDPYVGLMTYALTSVLSQAEGSLSYEALSQRMHHEYIRLRRANGPTLHIEGGDVKRSVLGLDGMKRSTLLLYQDQGSGKLYANVGAIDGIGPNSILAVYPPPGEKDGEKLLGYVSVSDVAADTCMVLPVGFEGVPKRTKRSLVGGRCEIVQYDFGGLAIAVSIDSDRGSSSTEKLESHLKDAVDLTNGLARIASSQEDADWFLRERDGKAVLVPTEQFFAGRHDHEPKPSVLGPFEIDDDLPESLAGSFRALARCENLLDLATSSREAADSEIDVAVTVRNVATGDSKWPVTTKAGDALEYQFENRGDVPVDVTLLAIDPGFGITSLFPIPGELNRLQPDEAPRKFPVDVDGSLHGRQIVVAILIEGKKGLPRANFTALEQPTLAQFRGNGPKGQEPALQQLLERAMYGGAGTRSLPSRLKRQVDFQVIPIDIVLEK
ncbi:caspase family protein [Roseiconus lacunae]|uniref:Caspase family protein n=1 Tax=Roseiconus lacunae TaxID=2605694 RepID=A0ABT7PS52_9BACT|nr:caspase family protein [Roseiconus lacunae]MDM4019334.1 caspase family protein [Roseiconus lacunae]